MIKYIFIGLTLLILVCCFLILFWIPDLGRKETFQDLVGTYKIDLSKTKLDSTYISDSSLYKSVTIKLYPNSTFKLNMDVPFLFSSKGRWKAGNVNEWCWLLFDGFNYEGSNNPGTQFTRPYVDGNATYFLINAATPKYNQRTISTIYFRKEISEN